MAQSEARARATKKYHAKFDDIKFRVPKGERQEIMNHAAAQGETLNRFLYRATYEAIARDNAKQRDT